MGTELNEQSTTAEVEQYVDELVNDVQADRAGEKKDDAQLSAEHTANEHPESKEPPADSGETAPDGEETGETWLTDDVKAEVSAYQLDEKDLEQFANREELDRALRLFDKTALEAGRKAMAEGEKKEESTRDEQGRFQKKEPEVKETKEGQFEITLPNEEMWDEDVATGIKQVAAGLRDHFETRIAELESRLAESDARVEEQLFDTAVDKLNMPKLFGKTGKESTKELQCRQDLLVQCKAQQIGLKQLTGQDMDLDSLVSRVAPMVFADEFDKHKLKTRTRKVQEQSNGRQGGGATRPQDPREDPGDEFERKFREMGGYEV